MKRLLIVVCIAVMLSACGCATKQCQRRTFWTDLADWLRLDEDAQLHRARFNRNNYWDKYFNVDDESLGYWDVCP